MKGAEDCTPEKCQDNAFPSGEKKKQTTLFCYVDGVCKSHLENTADLKTCSKSGKPLQEREEIEERKGGGERENKL